MDKLIDGYRRFRAHRWGDQETLYRKLTDGQTPRACVISCCDSRVDPVTIFDADPGLLFVIRNVANLVPPYKPSEGQQGTSTAIEFAVTKLKVAVIIVLGHARCGGIAAALDEKASKDSIFLKQWISLVEPAKARIGHAHDQAGALEHESIKLSIERLEKFPFVAEAVAQGTLKLVGARFSIFDGILELLNPETGVFEPLNEGPSMRHQTEELVRRYYAAFNARNWAGMLACLSDDVVHDVNQGGRHQGKAHFETFLAHMDRCYREELKDIAIMSSADGARASAEFAVHGTYLATDEGLPPAKGQAYVLPAATVFEVRNGLIARVSTHYNLKDWMAQVAR